MFVPSCLDLLKRCAEITVKLKIKQYEVKSGHASITHTGETIYIILWSDVIFSEMYFRV